jgi:hypothetical protein
MNNQQKPKSPPTDGVTDGIVIRACYVIIDTRNFMSRKKQRFWCGILVYLEVDY